MKTLTLLNGFAKLSDANLELRASQILRAMTDNAYFPDPAPSLAALATSIETYSTALTGCRDGDRLKAAIKNQQRDKLISLLHGLSDYVLFRSAGDNVIALSSGFSIGKTPAPAAPLEKPANLRILPGENSGELVSKINRVKGVLSYLYQYATDETLVKDNWETVVCSRSSCKLAGLQPGTKYNIRVAAIGPRQQLLYSDVVSRYVA